jgi:hypothetical protein
MNIWDPLTMYMYIECSSTVTCQNVWSLIRVLVQEPRRSFHVNAYKMYGPRTFAQKMYGTFASECFLAAAGGLDS